MLRDVGRARGPARARRSPIGAYDGVHLGPPGSDRPGPAPGDRGQAAQRGGHLRSSPGLGRAPGVGTEAAHRPGAEARAARRDRHRRLPGRVVRRGEVQGAGRGLRRRGARDRARRAPGHRRRRLPLRPPAPRQRRAAPIHGGRLGFAAVGLDLVDEGGESAAGTAKVSSTAIRQALVEGDLATATRMLGRPYEVRGLVAQGDDGGRELESPPSTCPSPATSCCPPRHLRRAGQPARRARCGGLDRPPATVYGPRPTSTSWRLHGRRLRGDPPASTSPCASSRGWATSPPPRPTRQPSTCSPCSPPPPRRFATAVLRRSRQAEERKPRPAWPRNAE